jgi:hypothetical protein
MTIEKDHTRELELRRELGLPIEEEVAALAGAEVKTVVNWRAARTGPPFTHLGRRPLYRVQALLEWLKSREEDTQA